MTLVQAIVMAVLQGISELFPISSLGHSVVVPRLIGWNMDTTSEAFLPFLVALHLGTAVALALYFWRDWWELLQGLLPSPVTQITQAAPGSRHMLTMLVLGTVPAGILGLLLEKRLAALFGQYQAVALFLVLNGVMLLVGEWLRRRSRSKDLSQLRPSEALTIGLAQAIALLPGFSRSGAAMVGGLAVGLTHEAAARFAFLLSTPIILAAAVLELPKLGRVELASQVEPILVGAVVAGVVAYLSTAFLMRYFRTHEVNALLPFAVYCAVLGTIALVGG
ncbi:MAG: undecaprenyl-diphosphate phosphatase [Chloroflexota bacterium]